LTFQYPFSRKNLCGHTVYALCFTYYVCEIRSKASSLGNARKRMGKSPPRYHRQDIFVSCGAAGNYSVGNNGSGGLDGGINYSVGLNERSYHHPLFETGTYLAAI